MKGLLVWAPSMCRSMTFLYRELSVQLNVPLKICVGHFDINNRGKLGFSSAEFDGINYELVGDNIDRALNILNAHQNYHHIFAVYHNNQAFRTAFHKAYVLGCKVALLSEAPINMEEKLIRHYLKVIYNKLLLPVRVKRHTREASFFVNLSGDDSINLSRIGWDSKKIIASGYYPPPIVGSCVRQRGRTHHDDIHILCTGPVSYIRGTHVLIEACRLLKTHGLNFRITVTQDGPLRKALETGAMNHGLSVDFRGFLPLDQLISLYEECTCFVACGLAEPWGIRVNDALNCGSPVVVSDGMGSKKLVNQFGVGRIFRASDPVALANVLFELISDREAYLKVADASASVAEKISPKAECSRLIHRIEYLLPDWLN